MIYHKHDFIIRKCKGKSVLHIGATDEPYHLKRFHNKSLLHLKLMNVSKKVIGLDYDKKSIKDLKKQGIENIYFGDIVLNKYDKEIKKYNYDIIIFGDVIEHLNNPGTGLENLKQFMDKNTELILTTPNVWSIFRIKNFFKKAEINHPDHRFWPSLFTMKNIIEKQNFHIKNEGFLLAGSEKDNLTTLKGKLFKKIVVNRIQRWGTKLYFVLSR